MRYVLSRYCQQLRQVLSKYLTLTRNLRSSSNETKENQECPEETEIIDEIITEQI